MSMEWNTIQSFKIYALEECRLQNNIYNKIPISQEKKTFLYKQKKAKMMSQDSIRKICTYIYIYYIYIYAPRVASIDPLLYGFLTPFDPTVGAYTEAVF